jgi:hypothetical protein
MVRKNKQDPSKKHIMGDIRIQKPICDGASQSFPEGWVIELRAIPARHQKSDCHMTGSGLDDVTSSLLSAPNPDEYPGQNALTYPF